MCRYGDIFWAELGRDADGSMQTGGRPVLVISNNKANQHSPVITVIPITSKMCKAELPTHVLIKECGLKKPSIVLAEQITSINKDRLERKMGSIQHTVYVGLVKKAIGIQLCL